MGISVLNWRKIEQEISASEAGDFVLQNHTSIAGGDINQALKIDGLLEGERKQFFIKFNQAGALSMFLAEAAGLQALQQVDAIYVPRVICVGEAERSYLVLENLNLSTGGATSARQLGEQLAQLHRRSSGGASFGWQQDNTIGLTRQKNTQSHDWITFWREQRLGFQLQLAKKNGASHRLLAKGEKLQDKLEVLFAGHRPEASLLHGDLWSGNYGYLQNGQPVIFDPAVYYGDREADIAMTELFGGFPAEFYAAYNEVWPLHQGYATRKTLYNLYHVLNHFNLFAGGYAVQAEQMIDKLLQAC